MVTAEHVASAMKLSAQSWKPVELVQGETAQSVSMRVWRIEGSGAERIAILELSTAYAGAQSLQLRMEPLDAEERVVGLAYPKRHLRFATGRFVQYADGDAGSRAALFEMYDGEDRLVLDHGASGAAILDCEGRVVAVVKDFESTKQ
jgi:Trypsin-like peptidase domain